MARRNVLLLYKTLLGRSADLRKTLASELANLRDFKATDSACDSVDVAFEASSDEMSSQLAELDARELSQIERAVTRLLQGTYGVCEKCQRRIRVARLNALPYTTFCINCEREVEKYPHWLDQRGSGNWARVVDAEAPMPMQGERINLSELEKGLCSRR